jgi:hypothetical protein
MKYCSNSLCAAKVADDARFCSSCGERIKDIDFSKDKKELVNLQNDRLQESQETNINPQHTPPPPFINHRNDQNLESNKFNYKKTEALEKKQVSKQNDSAKKILITLLFCIIIAILVANSK